MADPDLEFVVDTKTTTKPVTDLECVVDTTKQPETDGVYAAEDEDDSKDETEVEISQVPVTDTGADRRPVVGGAVARKRKRKRVSVQQRPRLGRRLELLRSMDKAVGVRRTRKRKTKDIEGGGGSDKVKKSRKLMHR